MEIILFYLFFIGIIGLILWSHRQQIIKQEQLLDIQAAKRHGNVVKSRLSFPKLYFPYRTYQLTVFSQPKGKNTPPHTYARVQLSVSRDIRFNLHKEGVLGAIGEMVGIRDLQIGNASFDAAFSIRGNDEMFIRALLNAEVQQQLRTLHQRFEYVKMTQNTFELSVRYIPETEDEHDHILEVALACLERLDTCTQVQTIIFGKALAETTVSEATLCNPEISDAMAPMLALNKVIIDAENSDFYQVERFLTYAINYIGRQYLQEHVEVEIYDAMGNFHPNLLNNFRSLCQAVQVHQTSEQKNYETI